MSKTGLYLGDTPIGKVGVGVFSEGGIVPSGAKTISANGTYDVTEYASAEVNVPSTGIDTSDATATAADMAEGVTAYVNGEKITGSLVVVDEEVWSNIIPVVYDDYVQFDAKIYSDGLYRAGTYAKVRSELANFGDATAADVAVGKTFTSSAGLKVTGTATSSASTLQTKTVTPSESEQTVSPDSGYDGLSSVTVGAISTTYVGSGVTKKSAQTYIPTTSDQTIASGQYLNGIQTIKGDANLTAANIKSGVSIFGVTGTLETSSGSTTNNCEAYHITSTSDTISFSGTGTVKVWGYGLKSTSTYNKTTYSFVGDGYYSGSSYSTPTKTTASFSISDGVLQGLPSNLTTVDLLVTIGV